MSKQHTQGRLRAVNHDSDKISIIDSRGFEIVELPNMPILLGYQEKLGISHWADRPGEAFLELEPEDQSAIAHRLVACWNACEGINTERLEDLGRPLMKHIIASDERAARMVQERRQLEVQRDQLLKALTDLASVFSKDSTEAVIVAAFAAIDARKPHPTVQHLPSDDTEGGAL